MAKVSFIAIIVRELLVFDIIVIDDTLRLYRVTKCTLTYSETGKKMQYRIKSLTCLSDRPD